MKDRIFQALLTFIDFIYAIVFALIVQQLFDEVANQTNLFSVQELMHLLLLAVIFYVLAWDWILGRILTLRNPYQSYSRFFLEVLIAIFAYGTASAAIKEKLSFLVYFSAVLFWGGIWAKRTNRQLVNPKDLQELCIIQSLQFSVSGIVLMFYIYRRFVVHDGVTWVFEAAVCVGIWAFILVYEVMVPRYKGLVAGPSVPFIAHPDVRRIRKFLLA